MPIANQPGVVPAKKTAKIVLVVVVVALLAIIGATIFCVVKNRGMISKDTYQAVFLANGQVYFGKVTCLKKQYVELKDIYYLQMKQALQNQSADLLNQPDLSLIKLGNELHGPTDEMYINRDQVLFVENLKEDSKVVQAIKKYNAAK